MTDGERENIDCDEVIRVCVSACIASTRRNVDRMRLTEWRKRARLVIAVLFL